MTAANRPGRNDPCHCGSGKKYKHCHLAQDEAEAAAARAKAASEAPPPDAEAAPARPVKQPQHATTQPWKGTTARGFTPKNRTPRKVGGS